MFEAQEPAPKTRHLSGFRIFRRTEKSGLHRGAAAPEDIGQHFENALDLGNGNGKNWKASP